MTEALPPGALPVLKLGNPMLRKSAVAIVDSAAAHSALHALHATLSYVQTLYDFSRGSGMAAPQLGFEQRIFVAEIQGRRWSFINPVIVARSEEIAPIREGCLSFFDYRGMVPRSAWVRVRAQNEALEAFEIEGQGNLASLLQHEIDHLDGILYFDRIEGGFDALTPVQGMPVIP
jgi:peptide deformylase